MKTAFYVDLEKYIYFGSRRSYEAIRLLCIFILALIFLLAPTFNILKKYFINSEDPLEITFLLATLSLITVVITIVIAKVTKDITTSWEESRHTKLIANNGKLFVIDQTHIQILESEIRASYRWHSAVKKLNEPFPLIDDYVYIPLITLKSLQVISILTTGRYWIELLKVQTSTETIYLRTEPLVNKLDLAKYTRLYSKT